MIGSSVFCLLALLYVHILYVNKDTMKRNLCLVLGTRCGHKMVIASASKLRVLSHAIS